MNPAVALSPLPAKISAAGTGATYVIPNSSQSGHFGEQADSQQTEILADFSADMLLSSVLAESAEIPVSDELLSPEQVAELAVVHNSSETLTEAVLYSQNIATVESKFDMPVAVSSATDTGELRAGSQLIQPQIVTAAAAVTSGALSAAANPLQAGGMTVAQRWQNEQPVISAAVATGPQSQTPQPAQTSPVLSLQQFLQQWQGPSQTTATATQAEATVAVSSNHQSLQQTSAATFQWKAESLGQQSASWGQKLLHLLSDKVNLQLGQQIQRAQIRLDPPHLGAIDLSVTIDGDRTTVQLYASNQQVREAMQQHLDQLRQTLSQRMGEDMGIEVSVRQHNEQQEGKSFSEDEKIDQQHEVAAVTTETTQAGNKQHTGWLNRLV